jgi:hypothetical protein
MRGRNRDTLRAAAEVDNSREEDEQDMGWEEDKMHWEPVVPCLGEVA